MLHSTLPVLSATSPAGTAYVLLPPHDGPAPTLFLFAWAGADTLMQEPYCLLGRHLHAQGWNVVSLDLPCHGADCRPEEPKEIVGWAHRTATGEDFVAPFQAQVADVLAHLLATGRADPERIAAAGTSRGGYLAAQAAASCPQIRAVAGFGPVTDLRALTEFQGQDENPLLHRLALAQQVEALADRALWLIIGNHDTRVGTEQAIAFARGVTQAAVQRDLAPLVTLHVLATPGHASFPAWHAEAAAWLGEALAADDKNALSSS
jgi:pimeloyl-ACP methyl ester carboxylesterase